MQAQYKHTPVKVNGESIQMHVYKNKKKVNWCFRWRRNKFIATVDWYCAQILGDCLHWRHVFFFSNKEYLLSFVNEIVFLHSKNTCSTPVAYARFFILIGFWYTDNLFNTPWDLGVKNYRKPKKPTRHIHV